MARQVASFYDLPAADDVEGKQFDFSQLKGKVVYAVNVASKCGYTKENYEQFNALVKKPGVDLLLFPCSQFGGQEFRSEPEIKDFVEKQGLWGQPNVHVLKRGDVTGPKMQEAWKLLKEAAGEADPGWGGADPGWNFEGKFVINKTGQVRRVPRGGNVEEMINTALGE